MRVGELIELGDADLDPLVRLEHRLNRTSSNSSLPPSQDPPSAPSSDPSLGGILCPEHRSGRPGADAPTGEDRFSGEGRSLSKE
jgi:hypothetical protein